MFLSHQQTIGTTPTACIRFAVLSRVEIPHALLEHCYDSQRNQNTGLSWPTSSATASHEKPGSAQSAPTVPAVACRRRIGCTPRREGSGRLPGDVPRRRRSWQGPPAGRAESRIPRCLASASSDRTVQLYGRPSPVRSAPRRLVTPTSVVPVAFSPSRTLVAGGLNRTRGWRILAVSATVGVRSVRSVS